jgi:hypothetical protein
MKTISEISWKQIEDEWRCEEDNEIWRDFYRKRGFAEWEHWRWSRKQMLHLPERKWLIYRSENPVKQVGKMYCDATTRWTDFYSDREQSTFTVLKDHPFFSNHGRVLDIRKNFPNDSQIIALGSGDKTFVFDGHHRAVALAGMDENYAPDLRIAYSEVEKEEFDRLFTGSRLLKAERRLMDVIGLIRSRLKVIIKSGSGIVR